MKILTLIGISLLLALQGCNGGDANTKEDTATLANVKGEDEISSLYKKAIVRALTTSTNDKNVVAVPETAESVTDASDAISSSTNTQEVGVDEADRVEFNGDHLFLLTANNYQNNQEIKAFDKSDLGLGFKKSIPLPEHNYFQGLYLYENTLTAVGESTNYYYREPLVGEATQTSPTRDYEYQTPNVTINIIADQRAIFSENALDMHQFTLNGTLVSSRRVGDYLYIISRFTPNFQSIDGIYYGQNQQELEVAIAKVDPKELTATYQYNDNEEQVLSENCYLEDVSKDEQASGYSELIYLTKIEIEQPSNIQSVCIGAQTNQVYASKQSIVLFSDIYDASDDEVQSFTQLHKFDLANLAYKSSGRVTGSVSSNNASYRFSEQGNYLRVLTSERNWTDRTIEHKLFVLDTSTIGMSEVARLPEEGSGQTIGKPGEDIYAVRYRDNKAYVVTFRRTDPLYVLDLTEPSSPKIEGQLEIPGYSAYLHPVNENMLIGIGRQTDGMFWGDAVLVSETVPTDKPEGDTPIEVPSFPKPIINDPSLAHGAKISLFDISDPMSPLEIVTYTYPNTYTEVEYDFHAFTSVARNDGSLAFSVPLYTHQYVQTFDQQAGYWIGNSLYQSSLELFETTDAMMERIGAVQPNYVEYPTSMHGHRSIIDGDRVYFVDGDSVWQADWATPSDAQQVSQK